MCVRKICIPNFVFFIINQTVIPSVLRLYQGVSEDRIILLYGMGIKTIQGIVFSDTSTLILMIESDKTDDIIFVDGI